LRRREWGLAREVAALFGRVIPGFGASDCGCEGHLFHSSMLHMPTRTGTSRPAVARVQILPRYHIYATVVRDGRSIYIVMRRRLLRSPCTSGARRLSAGRWPSRIVHPPCSTSTHVSCLPRSSPLRVRPCNQKGRPSCQSPSSGCRRSHPLTPVTHPADPGGNFGDARPGAGTIMVKRPRWSRARGHPGNPE